MAGRRSDTVEPLPRSEYPVEGSCVALPLVRVGVREAAGSDGFDELDNKKQKAEDWNVG